MVPFKHILVPTDFGEPSERALDVAIDLASILGSKLTLFHASWLPPSAYGGFVRGLNWPTDEMAKGANEEFTAALAIAKGRYAATEGLVVTGEPWRTILMGAKELGADIIVMGTHGRRGLSHVLLGSVAEKIVRLAPIAVLTISGKADQEAKEKGLERIIGSAKG